MKQAVREGQTRGRGKRAERGPFPLVKVLGIFLVLLVLSVLVVVGLLANTHNNSAWTFLAPALISLLGVFVPVLQWLFPIAPDETTHAPLPPSQAMSSQTSLVQPAQVSSAPESIPVNEQAQARPTLELAPTKDELQKAANAMRPATVFLSYAREDRAVMQDLQLQLNVRGVRTSLDGLDLLSGVLAKEEVERAIEHEVDAFALYITPASMTSPSLWDREVPAALRRSERDPHFVILPIVRDLSLADLRQFCVDRDLPDLTRFPALRQIDIPADQTAVVRGHEFRDIARTLLKVALTQRLRRVAAERAYEPCLCLHTWDYQPPTPSLDLDLNWIDLIPEKHRLPTPEEWEQLLLPALQDVKQTISARVSSRRLHLFVQSILPVAIALGLTFPQSSSFTLSITDQYGSWSTEGNYPKTSPLRSIPVTHSHSDPKIAVVELAISRQTERGVADALASLGFAPGHHLRLEPLKGPARDSIKDNAHALAMAHQIDQVCHDLCDQQGVEHIHLFAALTASLAVLIGYRLNALCPLTLYEFSEEAYKPAVTMR